mgnify:CR=1 FL=1
MIAPSPENESERIRKLTTLELLDTLPEKTYDDITYLAAEIADTPIALVSLIDQERQWFKARVGLDVTETSRDFAFCAHAILTPGETLVVPDAECDPRFADNPLVTGDPKIRFYAGAPLVLSDGIALGTLCVIDRKPRSLTDRQLRALEVLSRQVVAQIELRQALNKVKQLGSMLPICAHCKNIRDDKGYWEEVESYISKHSDTQFTHGICPDCIEANFPEFQGTRAASKPNISEPPTSQD